MPEPDDVTRDLRRHADWLDRSLAPVDPAELRRRADGAGGPTASTDGGPVPLTAGDPPRRSRLPFLAVAAALLAVVGVVGALLIGARGGERGEPVELLAPPGTDPGSADFCAAMHGYLETYQRETAAAGPSSDDLARARELRNQADAVGHEIAATEAQIEADPDHAEAHRQKAIALRDRQMELELEADDIKVGSRVELAERAVADFERLTQQSPPEVRGAMELLLAQGQRMLAEGPSQPVRPTAEEAEANNAIDDWMKAHCGFTMSNPNPVASSPGSTPDTAPAGTMVVGAPGP